MSSRLTERVRFRVSGGLAQDDLDGSGGGGARDEDVGRWRVAVEEEAACAAVAVALLVAENLLDLVLENGVCCGAVGTAAPARKEELGARACSLVRDLVDGGCGAVVDALIVALRVVDGVSSTVERASRPLPRVSIRLHGHKLAHSAGRGTGRAKSVHPCGERDLSGEGSR